MLKGTMMMFFLETVYPASVVLTFASSVEENCLCAWRVGLSPPFFGCPPAWLLGFGQQQHAVVVVVQTKWLISKEERREREREREEGAGGGNDSFMAAEKGGERWRMAEKGIGVSEREKELNKLDRLSWKRRRHLEIYLCSGHSLDSELG